MVHDKGSIVKTPVFKRETDFEFLCPLYSRVQADAPLISLCIKPCVYTTPTTIKTMNPLPFQVLQDKTRNLPFAKQRCVSRS